MTHKKGRNSATSNATARKRDEGKNVGGCILFVSCLGVTIRERDDRPSASLILWVPFFPSIRTPRWLSSLALFGRSPQKKRRPRACICQPSRLGSLLFFLSSLWLGGPFGASQIGKGSFLLHFFLTHAAAKQPPPTKSTPARVCASLLHPLFFERLFPVYTIIAQRVHKPIVAKVTVQTVGKQTSQRKKKSVGV